VKLEDINGGMQVHTVVDGKLKKVTAVVKNGVPGHELRGMGYYSREFVPFTVFGAYSEDELPAARKAMAAKRKAARQAEDVRKARAARAADVADALGSAGVAGAYGSDRKPGTAWDGCVTCRLTLEQAETLLAALERAKVTTETQGPRRLAVGRSA